MNNVLCLRSDVPPNLCRRGQSVRVMLNSHCDVSHDEYQADYILEFKLDESGFVFLQLVKDSLGKGVFLVKDGFEPDVKTEIRHRQVLCLNEDPGSWTGIIIVPGGSKCVAIACTRLEFYFTLCGLDESTDLQSMTSPA